MTDYYFYTGSYLNKQTQNILEGLDIKGSATSWNSLTINPSYRENKQVIHVLFYESFLIAFREIYTMSSKFLPDSDVYGLIFYMLNSLCSSILEKNYVHARLQCIHFVYSSGEKFSLKNSLKVNQEHLANMVDELDYRFLIESITKKYMKDDCRGEALIKKIINNEMLPKSQATRCADLIEWHQQYPDLRLDHSDEHRHFDYYRMYAQRENCREYFHLGKEKSAMCEFLENVKLEQSNNSFMREFSYQNIAELREKSTTQLSAAEKNYWLSYEAKQEASYDEKE